jgi:hypothetical protein
MSQSELERCGGFARFPTLAGRDEFARAVFAATPELQRHVYLPQRRPEIVFEDLSRAQREEVRKALEGRGKWFDDVSFEPTAG